MPTSKTQLQLQKALPQQEAFSKFQLNKKPTAKTTLPHRTGIGKNFYPTKDLGLVQTQSFIWVTDYTHWCICMGTAVIGKDTLVLSPF
jgi:hypothetical protein